MGGTAEADAGLLGPSSVTWQLHADPAMWLGGISSLYLQALHPRAVAAIVQNSNFREDPLGRLSRTGNFVGLATYGTTAQARAAAAKVRAVHRSLRAKDPRTGRRFRIDEPDLLLWVHCAEVASFLAVVRRAGFALTAAQADRYLAEQRETATLVGLHVDDVPGSTGELADYFRIVRHELRRTEDSEVVYRFLQRPPLQGPLRAGLPVYQSLVGELAYALLPDWAIELHGHRAYSPDVATGMLRALRSAALLIPGPLRWRVPHGHANQAIARLGRTATPSPRLLPKA
ncbi:DUF2236 domain-containing protein [Solihabitans fulvus]|uniref:DUF2236 domain-containing protein n=1 Tax=Solihabitans fulvus TaxID=1892852 RepID=A0A5B2XPM7_9PSEU|nr:oxygenase MpaB family protein [Solihabitans fulvus]KAA2264910.1 DUF2236 domain-containing protein [Solihabitans fulvus]